MKDRIDIDICSGVADVRLIRSEKMNALDDLMFDALIEAGDRLRVEPELRVVVLSGEGRCFCAGLDMESFGSVAPGEQEDGEPGSLGPLGPRTHGIANRPQYATWVWRELPVPVIAAVHGVALGGGFQLALAADMRYVAPATRMSVMEIKWGLVPDMAGTQLMRHLARDDVVRELTYSGRIFDADEALKLGFATRICDNPRDEALQIARQIAGRNPDAIRAGKDLLNRALYADPAEGLQLESDLQDRIIGRPNQIEAVMAEIEGREACFK